MKITGEKVRKIHESLWKKLFLSSMMGITGGSFCSERGESCAMVQMGAYLVEPPAYGKRELVLPPGEKECISFFIDECRRARGSSKVRVCLNLATPKLEWGLKAAECFYKAGGDILELNIHGDYEPYLRLGKLRAMALPQNRAELFRWLEIFSKVDIPVIAKFKEGVIPDYRPVLDKVADLDLFGVHFNIRDEKAKRPDFEFVRNIKKRYSLFLLVSGYVRSGDMVRKLFEVGADMVGFAEPTLKDPKFINNIAGQKT
ncbi:MAG: hypothetical protein U9O41_01400 [Candidatus Aerophobetes bacterium]|nr:hypothetical protein [Candidatus Aerophobetes bacterium]